MLRHATRRGRFDYDSIEWSSTTWIHITYHTFLAWREEKSRRLPFVARKVTSWLPMMLVWWSTKLITSSAEKKLMANVNFRRPRISECIYLQLLVPFIMKNNWLVGFLRRIIGVMWMERGNFGMSAQFWWHMLYVAIPRVDLQCLAFFNRSRLIPK